MQGDEFSSALSADEEENSGSISLPFSTKSLTVNYKFAQMCLAKQRREKKSHEKRQDDGRSQQTSEVSQNALENSTGFTEALATSHLKSRDKKLEIKVQEKSDAGNSAASDIDADKEKSVPVSEATTKTVTECISNELRSNGQQPVTEKTKVNDNFGATLDKVEVPSKKSETVELINAEGETEDSLDSDTEEDGSSDSGTSSGSESSSNSGSESGSKSGTGSQSGSESGSADSDEDSDSGESTLTAGEADSVNKGNEKYDSTVNANNDDKHAENRNQNSVLIEVPKSLELSQNEMDNESKTVNIVSDVPASGTFNKINSTNRNATANIETINAFAYRDDKDSVNIADQEVQGVNSTFNTVVKLNSDATITVDMKNVKVAEHVESKTIEISEETKTESDNVENTDTKEMQSESEDSSSEDESDSDNDESTSQDDNDDDDSGDGGSESDNDESAEENADDDESESSESSEENPEDDSAAQDGGGKSGEVNKNKKLKIKIKIRRAVKKNEENKMLNQILSKIVHKVTMLGILM